MIGSNDLAQLDASDIFLDRYWIALEVVIGWEAVSIQFFPIMVSFTNFERSNWVANRKNDSLGDTLNQFNILAAGHIFILYRFLRMYDLELIDP